MAEVEPQYASDSTNGRRQTILDRTTVLGEAVKSVTWFAVIGGAVPWLLLGEADWQAACETPHGIECW